MKRIRIPLGLFLICLLFSACASSAYRIPPVYLTEDRMGAVVDVEAISYSTIELPETQAVEEPFKIEVVVTAPPKAQTDDAPISRPVPRPTEYFTVKFVDTNGYTALSVQTVEKGKDALPPEMEETRGDLIFRGWDGDYTNVRTGKIVKAIYQKEWLTVNFFDADGRLLKTEQVRYGEDAEAPTVRDREGFEFDGWNGSFADVRADSNVYATYYESASRRFTALADAYRFLTVTENTLGLPVTSYYRKSYPGTYTVRKNEYSGNILYGNFCDRFDIDGYGFTAFSGILGLSGKPEDPDSSYSIRLYLYCDGELRYDTTLTRAGSDTEFSVDLAGVKELTVRLEPMRDDSIYYENPTFIGGLINAVFYEN